GELRSAQDLNRDVETRLRSLLAEAGVHGLVDDGEALGNDRAAITGALRRAASFQSRRVTDDETQRGRELELGQQAGTLRRQLRVIAEERKLLTDLQAQESGYTSAVGRGMSRLSALHLVPDAFPGEESCPVCGSVLDEPDPTVTDMHATLGDLTRQLDAVHAARPRREHALRELDLQAAEIRQQLRGVEGALSVIAEERSATPDSSPIRDPGLHSRPIDAYLSQIDAAGPAATCSAWKPTSRSPNASSPDSKPTRRRRRRGPPHPQPQLHQRQADQSRRTAPRTRRPLVRLDVKRLTVVGTPHRADGTVADRQRQNWVGYHIAATRLHQYLVANQRPVRGSDARPADPAYYPPTWPNEAVASKTSPSTRTEKPSNGSSNSCIRSPPASPRLPDDRQRPRQPPRPWFQDCVRYNWRDGEALIPRPGSTSTPPVPDPCESRLRGTGLLHCRRPCRHDAQSTRQGKEGGRLALLREHPAG
ncbi:hypothetical protein SAMN05216371_8336, partial [Streptomyces sp. TLI_053]